MNPTAPSPAPPPAAAARRARPQNQNGQAMGRKGLLTRQRLVDAAVACLDTSPLRDLRVAEIARTANTSPATFYLYFNDVPDVVLAAIADVSQSSPAMLEMARGDWTKAHALATARTLVEGYVTFWQSHATLFRVRNLAAEEGDERFRELRAASIRPLLEALAEQVERAQATNATLAALHPASMAGTLLAMLERLAAVIPTSTGALGISPDRVMDSAAYLLATTLAR